MKNIQSPLLTLLISATLLLLASCYSFRGTSIPENVNTYYIAPFKNNALNSAPALATNFTEALKEKVRTQSRLVYTETDPHVEFLGTIVDYRVTSEAPGPNEIVAINRLTINTAVEFVNHLAPDQNWKNNFSFFFDFPSSTDLSAIEEQAIETILDQLVEDIFNKAFTNW